MALAENVTNIPTDVYAWSGLPKQYRTSVLESVIPSLTTTAKALPETISSGIGAAKGTLGQLGSFWQNAPNVINPYLERKMRGFKDATTGAFQGVLNNLARRGVLGSQVASDTLANLGAQLNQQQYGALADLALRGQLESQKGQAEALGKQAELDLAGTEMLSRVPGTLATIAGLGKASEQPWQPYQAFLNLLQTMI